MDIFLISLFEKQVWNSGFPNQKIFSMTWRRMHKLLPVYDLNTFSRFWVWIDLYKCELVLKLIEIGPVVLKRKSFEGFSVSYYVAPISRLERMWPFSWINLYLLHNRLLCAKFCWNWPWGSRESCNRVMKMSHISSLGKMHDPSFARTLNFLNPVVLCAKFGCYWLCSSGKDVNIFLTFSLISPRGKVGKPLIWTNWNFL